MTLLVTGGGGFVMSNLVKRWLLDNPSSDALVVDALSLDTTLEQFFEPVRARLEWRQADVLDPALWRDLASRNDIQHLVHGAAATSINRHLHADGAGRPGLSGARPSIATNVDGVLNALEYASRSPTLERMVYVSSGSVYATQGPDLVPEQGYVQPQGIYAVTKFVGEALSGICATELGTPITTVRLSSVYGPMDRATPTRDVRCVPNVIAHKGIAGETIRVRSTEAAGDFIHAEDVGAAIISLLRANDLKYDVYNVAAGVTATIGELLEIATERIPGLKFETVGEVDPDINDDPKLRGGRWGAYEVARIREDTEWQPRPLREAFHDYIDWLRGFDSERPLTPPSPANSGRRRLSCCHCPARAWSRICLNSASSVTSVSFSCLESCLI